jgi:hypothetical protein
MCGSGSGRSLYELGESDRRLVGNDEGCSSDHPIDLHQFEGSVTTACHAIRFSSGRALVTRAM